MATPSLVLETSKAVDPVVRSTCGAMRRKQISTRIIYTHATPKTVRGVSMHSYFDAVNFLPYPVTGGSNATMPNPSRHLVIVQAEVGLKIVGWHLSQVSNLPSGTFTLYKVDSSNNSVALGSGDTTSGGWAEEYFTGVTVNEGDMFYLHLSGTWTTNAGNNTMIVLYFE